MSTARVTRLSRFLLSSAVLAIMSDAGVAEAQTPPLAGSAVSSPSTAGSLTTNSPAQPSTTGSPAAAAPTQPTGSQSGGSLGPEFQFNASALFSESYISNPAGIPGASRTDYMSSPGITADLHEHSARITLDATYSLLAQFYANGTIPTQLDNNLRALGNIDVFPQFLDINLRAFAQPVIISSFGAVSAGDTVVPGSFRNSYGYFDTPDFHFNWGDFASFKTMPSIGQVFFSLPPGTSALNTFPGIEGPGKHHLTIRGSRRNIASRNRLRRSEVEASRPLHGETDRQQSLLSEKSGIANAQYALSHEWSLLATGGYDSISDTIPLTRKISGPVALGGFGLTVGRDFSFQAQAGERYNSLSFNGNLRYDIGATSLLTASANDYVQTPEGQLLNNLISLTALPNGTLTTADDVLENGSAASLTSFSIQSPDDPSLDQFISRYQIVAMSFLEQMDRTEASFSIFGTRRRTMLVCGVQWFSGHLFVGKPDTSVASP